MSKMECSTPAGLQAHASQRDTQSTPKEEGGLGDGQPASYEQVAAQAHATWSFQASSSLFLYVRYMMFE